jgi:hypothetical protein
MKELSFSGYWSKMGYSPIDVFVLLHQKKGIAVGRRIKKPSINGR